eukprot:s2441_g5.t1
MEISAACSYGHTDADIQAVLMSSHPNPHLEVSKEAVHPDIAKYARTPSTQIPGLQERSGLELRRYGAEHRQPQSCFGTVARISGTIGTFLGTICSSVPE